MTNLDSFLINSIAQRVQHDKGEFQFINSFLNLTMFSKKKINLDFSMKPYFSDSDS